MKLTATQVNTLKSSLLGSKRGDTCHKLNMRLKFDTAKNVRISYRELCHSSGLLALVKSDKFDGFEYLRKEFKALVELIHTDWCK